MTLCSVRFVAVAWLLMSMVPASHAESPVPVIPDIEVFDQEGRSHRFYTDLVKGKTVAINFLYTSCKTSCPAAAGLFSAVHHQVRADVRPQLTLLSVSIDPRSDRPAQLKAFADKFGAGPGWMFLTGTQQNITRLLLSLGIVVSNKADHSAVILVGNDAAGVWTRLYGQASVPMVTAAVASVAAAPTTLAGPFIP